MTREDLVDQGIHFVLPMPTGIPQGTGGHIGPIPNLKAAFNRVDSLFSGVNEEKMNAKIRSGGLFQYESKIK